MNVTEFRNLQARVERFRTAAARKDADGFTQALNDQSNEKLVVKGVKPPEQLEDELLTLCVWIWSMKDYLKELATANGQNPEEIEQIANRNDSLSIVADIANRAKHMTPNSTRCGDYAMLVDVACGIKGTALNSISFGDASVTLDVGKTDGVTLKAKIAFESGNRDQIENAFPVIEEALRAWETEAYPLIGG